METKTQALGLEDGGGQGPKTVVIGVGVEDLNLPLRLPPKAVDILSQ